MGHGLRHHTHTAAPIPAKEHQVRSPHIRQNRHISHDMLEQSHILGRQCRVGKPLRVQGLPQSATGAAFSTAVGLAMHVSHPQDECWDFEMPADRQGARRVSRALRWFRENW